MSLARLVRRTLWQTAQEAVVHPLPDFEKMHATLARAEQLTEPPPAPTQLAVVIPIRVEEEEEQPSAWDPEPEPVVVVPVVREIPPPRDEELLLQEINGCKTLLLEIIRRAAYDWVLYRQSRKLPFRAMADAAYHWLFVEEPESAEWHARMKEGKYITSFVAICESLDLSPEKVRGYVRRLTPKNVTSVGRPAEYRRRDVFSSRRDEDVYSLPGGLVPFTDDSDDDTTL